MNIKQLEEINKHLTEIGNLIDTDTSGSVYLLKNYKEICDVVKDELRNEVWSNYINPKHDKEFPYERIDKVKKNLQKERKSIPQNKTEK